MNAIEQDFWQEQADEPTISVEGRIDVQREDAYWQSVYFGESYYRADLDYDLDYAPAYCVGYIGFAQYGGCFEDAEKSLCANWIRIKGASRLTLDEAMLAIRAAWDHAAGGQIDLDEEERDLLQSNVVAAGAARSRQQPAYATA